MTGAGEQMSEEKMTLKQEIAKYCEEMIQCAKLFQDFFLAYTNGKCGDEMMDMVREVRHSEARCDICRREVHSVLYEHNYMPDLRSDIFDLIEKIDGVPNRMEAIVVYVSVACTPIQQDMKEDFEQMVRKTVTCVENLAESINHVLLDLKIASEKAKYVEDVESDVDKLERSLYQKIFANKEIDMGTKMLLRKFVEEVADVSDRAEDTSDIIELMMIKRRA